jgi:hypothetical protein
MPQVKGDKRMTRDEILAMESGRELDAIIAEKLMGWTEFSPIDATIDYGVGVNGYRRNYAKDECGRCTWFPFYSTDISAAWEVVEKMRVDHIYNMADFGRNMHKEKQHYVRFHPLNSGNTADDWLPRFYTLPEAICKAALLTLCNDPTESA